MGAPLEIVLAPAAVRDLRGLDRSVQKSVVALLDRLATDPRPPGAEKLRGHASFWRVRTGNYRVIYHIEDERLIVVLVIRDRKDVYRTLDTLDAKLAAARRRDRG